jgi:phosphoribosylformylglycinamidine cyclo-ligase
VPPVFKWIQQLGEVADEEMDRVFNQGIGLALVVSSYYAESIQRNLKQQGLESWMIGTIEAGDGSVRWS